MIIPELVDGCQLRCALCWNRSRRPTNQQMSLSVVEKILEKFGKHYRIDWFNWGEPLLHKEFPVIAGMIKDTNSRISSNFSLPISDEYLTALNNFKMVYISLSGMTEDIYPIYHIGGKFDLVMFNLRRFVSIRNTKAGIRWLSHPHNEHQTDLCHRFCEDNGLFFERVTLNVEVEDLVAGFEHELYNPHKRRRSGESCHIIKWVPIGVDGRYYLCCASHNVDTGYTIFDDISIQELIDIKSKLPLCAQCQECKLWKMF